MLDNQSRSRLIGALCARYPSYAVFEEFLDLQLDRRLSELSAPDPLNLVVFRVVKLAEARGWIGDLIEAAAADSPRSSVLQQFRAFAAESPPDIVEPDVVGRAIAVILLVPPRYGALADAVRADHRVERAPSFPTAEAARDDLAGADALVVSTEVEWSGLTVAHDLVPPMRALPVVLLQSPAPAPRASRPVASWLDRSVTQIVVAGDPRDTARRIVDHLTSVVRTSR